MNVSYGGWIFCERIKNKAKTKIFSSKKVLKDPKSWRQNAKLISSLYMENIQAIFWEIFVEQIIKAMVAKMLRSKKIMAFFLSHS
jgi:hypothetical protein